MAQPLNIISKKEKRGSIIMGLLWLTMVTGFPCVISGFTWAHTIFSSQDILLSLLLSSSVLIIYSFLASYLGSVTGQTFTVLTRSIFGLWGSYGISLFIVIIASLWYAITALFLSSALIDLFNLPIANGLLASILAIIMAFNNLYGFTGIALFAGYFAAPALILWILLVLSNLEPRFGLIINHVNFNNINFTSFSLVSSFVLGFGAWGNEADFWRYAKPNKTKIFTSLILCIIIGQIIFPLTGYFIGKLNVNVAINELPKLMNHYGYLGSPITTAVVLIASYFAVNDSTLYGITNAIRNVKQIGHGKIVVFFMLVTAYLANVLSYNPNAYLWVANLSASILPQASILLIIEWYLFTKQDIEKFNASLLDNVKFKWVGCLALLAGYIYGIINSSQVLTHKSNINSSNVLSIWFVSIFIYIILRFIILKYESQNSHSSESNKIETPISR